MERVHATSLSVFGKGVLIMGPSGFGKSDLALRLIDDGAHLISDDQTELRVVDGRLLARAPDTIRGLMEIRGFGLVKQPCLSDIPVCLVAQLVDYPIERMPEPMHKTLLGVDVPVMLLSAFEASAAAKLRFVVNALGRESTSLK